MRVRGIRRDQRLDAEGVAESEDGADIVVLGYAVQHARDGSALLGKKVVAVGLLRRNAIAHFGEGRSLLGAISSG